MLLLHGADGVQHEAQRLLKHHRRPYDETDRQGLSRLMSRSRNLGMPDAQQFGCPNGVLKPDANH